MDDDVRAGAQSLLRVSKVPRGKVVRAFLTAVWRALAISGHALAGDVTSTFRGLALKAVIRRQVVSTLLVKGLAAPWLVAGGVEQ